MDNIGVHADIVCKINKENSNECLFLNVRHSIFNKQPIELGYKRKDPCPQFTEIIKKSFHSFLKLKENFDYHRDTFFSTRFQNCELIYFTNKTIDIEVASHLTKVDNVNEPLSILSNGQGKIYKIYKFDPHLNEIIFNRAEVEIIDAFIKQFTLCVEQADNSELRDIIRDNMENVANRELVFYDVQDEISEWFSVNGEVKYLTHNDRIFTNCEMSSLEREFMKRKGKEKNVQIKFNDEYLSSIKLLLTEYKIVFRTFTDRGQLVYMNLVLDYIKYVSDDIDVCKNKEILFFDENMEPKLLERALAQNCSYNLLIAVICNDSDSSRNLIELCKNFVNFPQKHVFILCHEKVCHEIVHKESNLQPFLITDLEQDKQSYFLQEKVNWKGQEFVLESVAGALINEMSEIVSQLAQNEKVTRNTDMQTINTPSLPFIARNFILEDFNDFYTLLETIRINKNDFNTIYYMICKRENVFDQTKIRNLKFQIYSDESELEKKVDITKATEIFLFKYEETKQNRLLNKNNSELLVNNENYVTISENIVVENYINPDNKCIIISDLPGKGRTMILKRLAVQLNEKYKDTKFIVLFNLNQLASEFQKKKNFTCETAINLISTKILDENFSDNFKKMCSIPGKMIILIDAYDEIQAQILKNANSFILMLLKTEIQNLIIASNPYHCEQNFLRAKVLKVEKYNSSALKGYLQLIWNKKKENKYIKIHMDENEFINNFLQLESNEIFNNVRDKPLFIKILAEKMFDTIIELCNENDLVQKTILIEDLNLYSVFYSYFKEKIANLNNEIQISEEKINFKNQKLIHQEIAVREIFGKGNLNIFSTKEHIDYKFSDILGILGKKEKNGLYFLSQSFSYFFAAARIYKFLKSNPDAHALNFIFKEVLFENEYRMVRKFLNDKILKINLEIPSGWRWIQHKINTKEILSSNESTYISQNILYMLNEDGLSKIYIWLQKTVGVDTMNKVVYLPHSKIYFQLKEGNSISTIESDETDSEIPYDTKVQIFHNAIDLNYFSIVEHFIQLDPNCVNTYFHDDLRISPLYLAVKKIHFKIIELLVKYKAEIDCERCFETPLICALESRDIEIFKYMVQNCSTLDKKDSTGCTALMHIVKKKLVYFEGHILEVIYFEMAEILINNGADLKSVDKEGNSILFYAVLNNLGDITEKVLEKYDVSVDYNEDSALECAIKMRYYKTMKTILSRLYLHLVKEDEPNTLFSSLSSLSVAIICNDFDRVKQLLIYSKDVEEIAVQTIINLKNHVMLDLLVDNGYQMKPI